MDGYSKLIAVTTTDSATAYSVASVSAEDPKAP